MKTFAVAFFALAAASSAAVVSRQAACAECRFTFCDGTTTITPSFPVDRALTGAICLDGVTVGHVDETGEGKIDGVTPISEYMPEGLSQAFSPSFFKGYTTMAQVPYEVSGVGHEYPQGNQIEFLDGLCIALPIREYQIVDPDTGIVLENIATDDHLDCVAFTIDGEGVSGGGASPSPEVVF